MVKIHEDIHYNFNFTKVFRRVLTATRRKLYHLTTSKLTSSRITHLRTTALAPPCTTLSICRSSLNIMYTVFFDITSSEDKIRTVNRLSVFNQAYKLIFAITVDLMLDLPQLSSSLVTHVLLRIASATLKTLMIIFILSSIILKSSYASVFEFYLAIRKTVSLQCILRHRLTSRLISRNSTPLDVFAISPLRKRFQNQNLQNMMP